MKKPPRKPSAAKSERLVILDGQDDFAGLLIANLRHLSNRPIERFEREALGF